MPTSSNYKHLVNSARRLFQPINVVPKGMEIKREAMPKCQKLMLDMGIIRQASNGLYHLLPLGLRALNKLEALIDRRMIEVGAQKLQLPLMTEAAFWKTTGRWDLMDKELFKLRDRHDREYLLSPTHEEAMSALVASLSFLSHHQLPILLYQIGQKFRDEMKPRCGLLRSREFVMKDLYSFDKSEGDAEGTYKRIREAYNRIFTEVGTPYLEVEGATGDMGGIFSHEYHVIADVGEDVLSVCSNCKAGVNVQVRDSTECGQCGGPVRRLKGIEVGHTFLLGTKYSEALDACFRSSGGEKRPCVMGSYGIGLTRVLAASVESASGFDRLRWPPSLAPYSVLIVTPKDGSKESDICSSLPLQLYSELSRLPHLSNDILLDDRSQQTIGRRVMYAKCTGIPYILVVGSKATSNPPLIELIDTNDESVLNLTFSQILDFFTNNPIGQKLNLSINE